jgi:hypothetical protein
MSRLPRLAVIALPIAALALPAPAFAADRDLARAAERLQDPRTQDALAETLSALVGAMLDIKVGGIANAVAKADPKGRVRDVDPDMTVRDMAAKDNPDFAEKLDDDVRTGTRMVGALAGALVTVLPQLETIARDVEEQVKDAKDRTRR